MSKTDIAKKFDAVAKQYHQAAYLAKQSATALDQCLALMQLQPQHILDVGCGSGFCLENLIDRYPKAWIIGLDISPAMLLQAAKIGKTDKMMLCLSKAEQMAFVDHSFDLITANLSLLWHDFNDLLNECARLLKPNGLLLFSMLGLDSVKEQRLSYDDKRLRDMHLIGDDLLQCGFEDPVMEVDHLQFHYDRLALFEQEYYSLGLDDLIRLKQDLPAQPQVTFEMIYGHAWRQQPVNQSGAQGEVVIPLSKIRRRHQYPF